MQISYRVGLGRRWNNIWKQSIDALGPILGLVRQSNPFHPLDGRITPLGLHHTPAAGMGFDVGLGSGGPSRGNVGMQFDVPPRLSVSGGRCVRADSCEVPGSRDQRLRNMPRGRCCSPMIQETPGPWETATSHTCGTIWVKARTLVNVVPVNPLNAITSLLKEIGRCQDARAASATAVMVYVGIDVMAFLSMPETHAKQGRSDLVAWVDTYLTATPESTYQYDGRDVYGARCAMLHTYSIEADYHQQNADVKRFGYHDGGIDRRMECSRHAHCGGLATVFSENH